MIESMPKQSEDWLIAQQHFMDGYNTARKEMEHLGWHPASELPVIPKGENEVEVYCLVHGKGLTVLVPMKLHYTVLHGFGVSENIEIKWWSYSPKED